MYPAGIDILVPDTLYSNLSPLTPISRLYNQSVKRTTQKRKVFSQTATLVRIRIDI
jgi:hypothetical protein